MKCPKCESMDFHTETQKLGSNVPTKFIVCSNCDTFLAATLCDDVQEDISIIAKHVKSIDYSIQD